MYFILLAVVFLGALVRAEASKLAVRIPSIPGGVEARSLFGRELTFITCAEQGLEACGPNDYTCCEPGHYCTVSTDGKPGCCKDGDICSGGDGGVKTFISASTLETTSTSTSTHETTSTSTSNHETTSTSTSTHETTSTSTSTTKISSVSMPIPTESGNTGAPTNGTVPSATGLPTQVPGSGASGVSVQAGFVGVAVMIAGLFAS